MTGPAPASAAASPFARLAKTLAGIAPGMPAIDLALGEPRQPLPGFVGPALTANLGGFTRYPAIRGTDEFRSTVAAWLDRRYRLGGAVDAERMVLPLNGTREGLFFAALGAREWAERLKPPASRPVILLPNPFYQAYAAGAGATGAEPVFVAGEGGGDEVDAIAALPGETLARTIALFIAAPSNPQGRPLSLDAWSRLIGLARQHGFLLFADECYGEIYRQTPPPGVLEAAIGISEGFGSIVTFHSLSKRSGLPGLRCGFAAGDPDFLDAWTRLRNMAAPQVPTPVQAVAVAAYRDESHVAAGRAAYNARFAAAERILGGRFGAVTPPGGFFLWLDMARHGGGEAAALRLWREAGIRAVPGGYLAAGTAGGNPGEPFLRVALVQDLNTTEEALTRLARLFP